MNNQYFGGYQPNSLYAQQQQRLYQMEQQYPQLAQYQGGQQQYQQQFKCRPVTSIDEAKAAMIDLDGTPNVFTNLATGQIYVKYTNLDGTASLDVYTKQSVDKNEFSGDNKLNSIEERVSKLEEVILNDARNSTNDANGKNAKK